MVLDFRAKLNDQDGNLMVHYKDGKDFDEVLSCKWSDGGPQICWFGLFFSGPPSISTSQLVMEADFCPKGNVSSKTSHG